MNNPSQACESRRQDISLLAAGCLIDRDERELREHLAVCYGCRKEAEELAQLALMLRAAKPPLEPEIRRVVTHCFSPMPAPTACKAGQQNWLDRPLVRRSAVILLVVAITTLFGTQPAKHAVVRPSQQVRRLIPTTDFANAFKPPQPTLISLHLAAAESDESLNHLLDRYLNSWPPEQLSPQSQLQESSW